MKTQVLNCLLINDLDKYYFYCKNRFANADDASKKDIKENVDMNKYILEQKRIFKKSIKSLNLAELKINFYNLLNNLIKEYIEE